MKSIKKISILLLTSLFILSSCKEVQNANKPKNAISYKQAKELQKEYIKTRVKPTIKAFKNLGIDKNEDVRDVTFNLKEVKQYIAYVEKEAAKKGITDGLGLRVYLGAYEKGDVTMFFMPTKKKEALNGASNFFYFYQEDEMFDDIDGFNFGNSGKPPHDIY